MWLYYTGSPLTHASIWRRIFNMQLHMGRLVVVQFILYCLFVFKLTYCNNVISDCSRSHYCMLYKTLHICFNKRERQYKLYIVQKKQKKGKKI